MLTIYLVRHGQTEWNKYGRMQGRGNGELTDKGRKDAKSLGKRLHDTPLACIYSSTSKRAYETAGIIAGNRPIPIVRKENLQEMGFGDWEGQYKTDLETGFPEDYICFWETPHLFQKREGGEDFGEVRERAAGALNEIIANHSEGAVLIVAHSIFLRSLLAAVKEIPSDQLFSRPGLGHASLTKLTVSGGKIAIAFENDMSHCEE